MLTCPKSMRQQVTYISRPNIYYHYFRNSCKLFLDQQYVDALFNKFTGKNKLKLWHGE